MKLFYIPDGHRRYADRTGCSLVHAYRLGYEVLIEELIEPLFAMPSVSNVDVFLLSSLNLQRRDREELDTLLREGEALLWALIERCQHLASVRTVGNYLPRNVSVDGPPDKLLTLLLGCTTDDDVDCGEVDVFLRTGGEIRLSGAPRSIIGNYTQFYGLEELHPDLRFRNVKRCLEHYDHRYMRELQRL